MGFSPRYLFSVHYTPVLFTIKTTLQGGYSSYLRFTEKQKWHFRDKETCPVSYNWWLEDPSSHHSLLDLNNWGYFPMFVNMHTHTPSMCHYRSLPDTPLVYFSILRVQRGGRERLPFLLLDFNSFSYIYTLSSYWNLCYSTASKIVHV